ncbi:MAG: IPT/TIG domain-containing protein, partial [Sulfuricaulis sp.]|nr:IPT/TIG domain-containing protein [Sulfuricaulis sp.]
MNPGATKVEVNGLSAPLVQTMSSDLLLFMLPLGNTSGSICVTTSLGTACSAAAFGTALSGLNITALWPSQGVAGSVVFVFGSGFDPTPGNTQVSLGSTTAGLAQVLDPSLLLFLVPPPPATSGYVHVTVTAPQALTAPQTLAASQSSATSPTPFTVLSAAASVTRNYTLYITSGTWTINGAGGATLYAWSFTDQAGLT